MNIILREQDILNPEYSFDDRLIVAERVATSLAKVIEEQNLSVDIKGNSYVTVDGWNTLGTMLGCSPITRDVEDVTELLKTNNKERVYKATVSIMKGEHELSRAFAIASTKKEGKYGPYYVEPFAAYSMAQTRAIGKAYRVAFSWIIKMAGYESTPAEEMPEKEDNIIDAEIEENSKVNSKVYDEPEFTTADDIEPLELDPVHLNYCKTLKQKLINEGKDVTKRNMKRQLLKCIKANEIDEGLKRPLMKFINSKCPEELI